MRANCAGVLSQALKDIDEFEYWPEPGQYHLVPTNDCFGHLLEDCVCGPNVHVVGHGTGIDNSVLVEHHGLTGSTCNLMLLTPEYTRKLTDNNLSLPDLDEGVV